MEGSIRQVESIALRQSREVIRRSASLRQASFAEAVYVLIEFTRIGNGNVVSDECAADLGLYAKQFRARFFGFVL